MATTTELLNKAIAAMTALHNSLEPNDNEAQDASIPASALRQFVDAHAELMYARKKQEALPTFSELQNVLQAMVAAQHAGPITAEMHAAWSDARALLQRIQCSQI